jgi:hypothetical protein
MLKINRIECNDGFMYYEAVFKGGNLYAYSINELIVQLWSIYGFKLSLFEFNLN